MEKQKINQNYSRGFILYIYRYFCWIVYLEIGWWRTLCSWNFRMLFTYNVVCWDSSSTIFGICGTCGVVLGSGFQGSCPEEGPCPPGVCLVLAVVCSHSLPAQQCSTQALPQLHLQHIETQALPPSLWHSDACKLPFHLLQTLDL